MIKKYESLLKLDLPESERQWISEQAEKLLESFSALDAIDTSGVEMLVSVLDGRNELREDEALKPLTREELLSNAHEQYGGYFQIPRTV